MFLPFKTIQLEKWLSIPPPLGSQLKQKEREAAASQNLAAAAEKNFFGFCVYCAIQFCSRKSELLAAWNLVNSAARYLNISNEKSFFVVVGEQIAV